MVWNLTCECGHDEDFKTLTEAKIHALKHTEHGNNAVEGVYIDQVNPDGEVNGDYLTGKTVKVFNHKPITHHNA